MEYVTKPPRFLPIGKVLVHNQVQAGSRGFRAWLDDPDEKKYEVCTCGWAPRLIHHTVSQKSRSGASSV
jgi:hypothetical protein